MHTRRDYQPPDPPGGVPAHRWGRPAVTILYRVQHYAPGNMIAVVTDSTSDLAPDLARQLGIHVVPLTVHMNGRALLDWQEVHPDGVYEHLRAGHAASSEPASPERFVQLYRELLTTHDQVISLHISGKLSETVRNAEKAAMQLHEPGRVYVLDSRLTTAPLADLVLRVQEAVQAGTSAETAVQALDGYRDEQYMEFSVATLEYLRRGGRISRVTEVMGNLVGLRPVLTFQNGELKVIRRARSKETAENILQSLVERFGSQPVHLTITHAGTDPVRIRALRDAAQQSGLTIRQGKVMLLGPVIGAHVGPGTFGFMARPYAD